MGPVAWQEWGREPFARAKEKDLPVLLSITAPWSAVCRTMDRDTWADDEVARLANAEYVPVRVDADRRPDVNERYNCGAVPSTVFLTPEGDLLWGATFIPAQEMRITLVRLKDGFAANRAKLAEAIKERDTRVTRAQLGLYDRQVAMSDQIMRATLSGILASYDPLFGGFGKAPKFPLAPSLSVLVQAYRESGGPEFEGALVKTLDAISERGLFDPVDGGFFLCSRSEAWTQPETEKLLAEQAPLVRAFLDAGAALGEARYLEVARQTLQWARRRLWDPGRGLFRAGQVADAEYYVLDAGGRARRGAPEVPDAVYADACAAAASMFLRAAAVFSDDDFATVALRCLESLRRLPRHEKVGVAHTPDGVFGLLRDQVALATALLDAFEWTGEEALRTEAVGLLDLVLARYWNRRDGGLLDRALGFEELGELARLRRRIAENAAAAAALVRVGRPADAERILSSWPDYREDYGHHTAEYAVAVDALVRPGTGVTIPAGDAWGRAALRPVVPRRTVARDAAAKGATVRRGEKTETVGTPEELEKKLSGE
jgi:hypothetical protein